jgi:hypothetical protein
MWTKGPQVRDSIRIKCFWLGLTPLFHHFFPRIMLISDVISSLLILRDLKSHLLTPRSRVVFEKLRVAQLVKKFPAFYETMFTRARQRDFTYEELNKLLYV